MIKKILFFLCLLSSTLTYAQYTEIINSNRPGFSESPYAVGTDVLQFESGLFYRRNKIIHTFSRPESLGGTLDLRYGKFNEKLEFNVNIAYQRDEITFRNIFTSLDYITGLSKLTFGAKYLLHHQKYTDKSKEIRSWKKRMTYDWKRLIPSVAIYAGINTNFVHNIHKNNRMSPKIALLFQNNLSHKLIVVTNLIYDKIGTNNPNYGYITSVSYAINDKWSSFIENQGVFDKSTRLFNTGIGLAYLLNSNLQLDLSTRSNLLNIEPSFFGSLGISWRLDNHKNLKKSTAKNTSRATKKYRHKENFFNKLFKKNPRKKSKRRKRRKNK